MAAKIKLLFRPKVAGAVEPLPAPATLNAAPTSDTAISVSWSSVAGALGYELWSAQTENGTYEKIYTGTQASYKHTGLLPNSPHYYQARALSTDPARHSGYSVKRRALTLAPGGGGEVYGVIPVDWERSFVDDNSNQRLEQLGVKNFENVELGDARMTDRPDVVVNLDPRRQARVKKIKFGNGQHDTGFDEQGNPRPGIKTWRLDPLTHERIFLFEFNGHGGNGVEQEYVFPEAVRLDDFLFEWAYPIFTYLEFEGYYLDIPFGQLVEDVVRPRVKVQHAIGAVSYIYDFNLPSFGGVDVAKLLLAAKGFRHCRLYLDTNLFWKADTENCTFEPTHSGAWSADSVLRALKELGVEVTVCPKGNEGAWWYPIVCEQMLIRWGPNKDIPRELVRVYQSPTYPGNEVFIGLDLINTLQEGNEPFRWWKGRANILLQLNLEGYMSHKEYCVMGKRVYEFRNRWTPTVKLAVGGAPSNVPNTLLALWHHCKTLYNGEFFWDIYCYHQYVNSNGGQNQGGAPVGVQPELNDIYYEYAQRQKRAAHRISRESGRPDQVEVAVTETGYSIARKSDSGNLATNVEQTAVPTATQDTFQVAANWWARSFMDGLDGGLLWSDAYQEFDDGSGMFLPHLWLNWDLKNGIMQSHMDGSIGLRPAGDIAQQTIKLLFDYELASFDHSIAELRLRTFTKAGAPDVVEFNRTSHDDGESDYWLPVLAGKTPVLYRYNLGVITREFYYHDVERGVDVYFDRYTPTTEECDNQVLPVVNGFVKVRAKERPQFVAFT